MGTLLSILACLFVALFVLVKLTEKHGKVLAPEQQQALSKVIVALVAISLVAGLIKFMLAGS
ncbi:hypothetical protein [Dasania marina]|uniref:hypothetical protein n=1 Tax=Dasania marina TaxID=471499 RepID=UPI0030D713F9|tara:strand:+ start:44870 stop:45055 length:186 start_codon:yes stop_codon:yes gene_type:complete